MNLFHQGYGMLSQANHPQHSLFALVLVLSIVHFHLCFSMEFDDEVEIDKIYYYNIFTSNKSVDPGDGPSYVGSMCYPSIYAARYGKESVVFCDLCGDGSAIRIVNKSGLFTLTGSLTKTGFADGPPGTALFESSHRCTYEINGVSAIGDTIYVADTLNNAVRVVSSKGDVKTLFGKDGSYDNISISYPMYITPYTNLDIMSNAIISDSSNNRLLLSTFNFTTSILSLIAKISFPGKSVTTKDNKLLYYVEGGKKMGVLKLGGSTRWYIGNNECLGYKSSLALSNDEKELLYYGCVNNTYGVYSISANASPSVAPKLCPTLKFRWPDNFEVFRDVITYDENSWWVLTETSLYLVSTTPLSPSSSSSGSATRSHAVAAFPSGSLPTTDSCRMSQLFYWIRIDVEIAYKNIDYLTQFEPLDDPNRLIPGSLNVSGWCDNITASRSKDSSITFLNFWGPLDLSPEETQSALTNSDWYYTKKFLEEQGSETTPFCFVVCGEKCENSSFSSKMCVGYKTVSCDGVCKGAIISAVVIGIIGVCLFLLMIINPSNTLIAFVMIPVI